MFSIINIDTILSDWLLTTAAILLLLSPIVFLVAFIKFVTAPRADEEPLRFDDHALDLEAPAPTESALERSTEETETPAESTTPVAPPTRTDTIVAERAAPAPRPDIPPPPAAPASPEEAALASRETRRPVHESMERTTILPPGMAEVQGQLEIAITQIKTLNRKVYELEQRLQEAAPPPEPVPLSELKEPPQNPSDYMQKLMKLAEHVIVLEKEVARLRAASGSPVPGERR